MSQRRICSALAAIVAAVPVAAKDTRDAFDVDYTVIESDNFAVKYDADHAVDEAQVAALLEALEGAAAVFHGELDHRRPLFGEQFRINAYVAGPSSVPDIPTYGGYMTFDDDGAPILVFSQDLLSSGDPGLRLVAAHEYYHAIQLSTEAFADSPHASWYFEASANWAAHVADVDDDVVFGDVGTWVTALEHSITLDSNTMADDDPLLGHEYGVFLLPLCVSIDTTTADVAAIWEGAGPNDDAIDALADVAGIDAGLVVARCGARLARWDFLEPVRGHLETWLPLIGPFDVDTPPATLAITDVGLSVDVGAESGKALHAWGMHVVTVPPHAGVLSISVAGAGGERLPLVAVAARADGAVDAFDVDGDALVYDATGRGVEAVIVVAAPDERDPSLIYPDVITVAGVPFDDVFLAEPPPASCGCASAAPADVATGAVAGIVVARRRRRQVAQAPSSPSSWTAPAPGPPPSAPFGIDAAYDVGMGAYGDDDGNGADELAGEALLAQMAQMGEAVLLPDRLILNTDRLFASGKAQLRSEAMPLVRAIGVELEDMGVMAIGVICHTDSAGADTFNLKLSQDRATTLARTLGQVAGTTNVIGTGAGEQMPIADNSSSQGRRANRRCEIGAQ